ncbi:MAG: hypothetical protein BroJett025_01960 [Patescibacteria group bacterium]|nr:MAG: hypothetical protein BroJett025_01960 [Patescibacteria group bacterium]
MLRKSLTVVEAPDGSRFVSSHPVPTTPEHVLASRIPEINEIFLALFQDFADEYIFMPAAIDVLTPQDYPEAYRLAHEALRENSGSGISYLFPHQSPTRSPIIRNPLSKNPEVKIRAGSVVTPSDKNPLCKRYKIEHLSTHLGDIFVIPVIVKRNIFAAREARKQRNEFETLVIGVDAISNKRRSRLSRSHQVTAPMQETGGLRTFIPRQEQAHLSDSFTTLTDESFADPEVAQQFYSDMYETINGWMNLFKIPRK